MIIRRDMVSLKSRILLDMKPDEITTSIDRLSTGIQLNRSNTDRIGQIVHNKVRGARNPYGGLVGLLEAVETVFRRSGMLLQKMRDVLINYFRESRNGNQSQLQNDFSIFREDIITLLSFNIVQGVVNQRMTIDEVGIRVRLDDETSFTVPIFCEKIMGFDRINFDGTFEENDQILREAASKVSAEQFRIAGWCQKILRHHHEMGVISQNALAQGSPIIDLVLNPSDYEEYSLFKQLLR